MSRIGKNPIIIPSGTTVVFTKAKREITVKGSKGQLHQVIGEGFEIKQEEGKLYVIRPSDQKKHKALHGLYRSLIANMVKGIHEGYKIDIELVGIGYKAAVQDNVLELSLGYSHGIFMSIPPEIKIQAVTKKGTNPLIQLEGNDKQLIGHIGAKIKSLRKKDPYKGKGIYYVGEYVRRKAGKTASK